MMSKQKMTPRQALVETMVAEGVKKLWSAAAPATGRG